MTEDRLGFDFAAFKDAFERKDAATWAGFYTEDAEWVEYKPSAPPRDPIRMVGSKRIAEFLASLERSDIEITLADEVLGRERAAFSVDVTLPDGRRVLVGAGTQNFVSLQLRCRSAGNLPVVRV